MKTLRPDMNLKFKVSLGHDQEPPEQRDDDRVVDKLLPSTNTSLGEVRFMVDKLFPSTISNPGEVLVDRLLPSIIGFDRYRVFIPILIPGTDISVLV